MLHISQYLLKLSISLTIVYLFYVLVLRRLTFYKWNRWYLLGYSLAAFFIPFINVAPMIEQSTWAHYEVVQIIPVVGYGTGTLAGKSGWLSAYDYNDLLLAMFITGIIAMLIRLLMQYFSYRNIRRTATLLLQQPVKVYQVNKAIIPFSFGNAIYINQHQHKADELQDIIRHEFIHVKQKHTVDMLWAEVLCMLNWYNPFAWLIRRAIRQNLEFIADHQVLETGLDRKQYQYLLLKVIGMRAFGMGNAFNFSSLKKRIIMMNKVRSARIHLIKFLFVVPLLAVLLLAFRNHSFNGKSNLVCTGIVTDATTRQPLAHVVVKDAVSGITTQTDSKGFYKINLPLGDAALQANIVMQLPAYEDAFQYMVIKKHDDQINSIVAYTGMRKKGVAGITGFNHFFTPTDAAGNILADPAYSVVLDKYKEWLQATDRNQTLQKLVENSTKPIWVVDGIPYAFSLGSMVWFDKEEVEASPVFKVCVNGELMSMEEANQRVNRFDVQQVSASPRAQSLKNYGVNCNVLVVKTRSYSVNFTQKNVDTVPAVKPKATVIIKSGPAAATDSVRVVVNEKMNIIKKSDSRPLIIINDKEQKDGYEALKEIVPTDIETIRILKNESAIAGYGQKAKDGVILITTKVKKVVAGAPTPTPTVVVHKQTDGEVRIFSTNDDFKGIYIVNDKMYEPAAFNELKVKPEDILTIDVLKGSAAETLYGEKGRNGVIIVTTKQGVKKSEQKDN